MGTDDLGRDLFFEVVHGTRTSLFVALTVTALAACLGIIVGAVSGWRGGLLDDLLTRCTEFVQVVPRFFLAIVVIALLGPGLDRIVLLLALTSWPLIARVVRAEVLSLKSREFVEAARARRTGFSDPRAGRPSGRAACRRRGGLGECRRRNPARSGTLVPWPGRSGAGELGLSRQQRAAVLESGVVDDAVSRRGHRARRPRAQSRRRCVERRAESEDRPLVRDAV